MGFGVVGQSFAKLLLSRSADLYTQYGIKPRIVACVDNNGSVISPAGLDPNFPITNYGPAYDWCYAWLSGGQRTTVQGLLDDHEAECDTANTYFKADQHKHCALSVMAAVAAAGDGGETWATAHLAEYGTLVESLSSGYIGEESEIGRAHV